MKDTNFWSKLMGDDLHASTYMADYGEGVGSDTRMMISEFLNNGESVLDIGCGPGWNLDHFQEFGPEIRKYKGIDYSPRFIRVANSRWKNKIPKYKDMDKPFFVLGDCRHVNEANNSWDVVLLQDILEHTNGYENPVKEALRIAKKRIIITFWHLAGNEGTEHINDDGDDGYGAWYDKEKWESFLNTLQLRWYDDESTPDANRKHWFYIIEKRNDD